MIYISTLEFQWLSNIYNRVEELHLTETSKFSRYKFQISSYGNSLTDCVRSLKVITEL